MNFTSGGKTYEVENKNTDGYTIPEEGMYAVWIIDGEDGYVDRVTSKNGADGIQFKLQILNRGSHKGYRFRNSLYVIEAVMFFFENLYKAIEPDPAERVKTFKLDDDNFVHHSMFYRPFVVELKHEEYNGKTQIKVKAFYPLKKEHEDEAWDVADGLLANDKSGKGPRSENPYAQEA